MQRINVLIADDHELIIQGLKSLMDQEVWIDQIHAADTKEKLIHLLNSHQIDVLVQDIKFGISDAREFIPELKSQFPTLKIIALSSLGDKNSIESVLSIGANAYVIKSESGSQLIKTIQQCLENGNALSPESQRALFTSEQKNDAIILSSREKEVLKLILEEMSTKEIAATLFLSEKTVEHYRAALFMKFDVKNVTGLVKKAILNGFWQN